MAANKAQPSLKPKYIFVRKQLLWPNQKAKGVILRQPATTYLNIGGMDCVPPSKLY